MSASRARESWCVATARCLARTARRRGCSAAVTAAAVNQRHSARAAALLPHRLRSRGASAAAWASLRLRVGRRRARRHLPPRPRVVAARWESSQSEQWLPLALVPLVRATRPVAGRVLARARSARTRHCSRTAPRRASACLWATHTSPTPCCLPPAQQARCEIASFGSTPSACKSVGLCQHIDF